MSSLSADVQGLLHDLAAGADEATRTVLASAQQRLEEPLRVAIAGRIKAGKSTLLNAVIGTPVAASDAAECTRFVTWYRHGSHPLAYAVDRSGNRQPLAFQPGAGIDVDGLDQEQVERLEVEFPSPILQHLTLIDTPGIASISEGVSSRSTQFLAPDTKDQGADVLIYLLRFLHDRDADFLEAFTDPSARSNDPIRSVAVLSRSDEIGSGRGDGFAIARRAAERCRQHPALRAHVSDVMPVSGLIGLHANGISQRDYDDLRRLAALPLDVQDRLLLSVGRFVRTPLVECTEAVRESLLERLGIAGVRTALALLRHERDTTATQLADRLVDVSGIEPFRVMLTERYAQRSDVLKASRAIDLMKTILADGHGGSSTRRELERIEINAHEIVELRALRDIARLEQSPDHGRGLPNGLIEALKHALGSHGFTLQQRLQSRTGIDLEQAGTERVGVFRAAQNSPALPRQWQTIVRTAIGSIEVSMSRS